AKPTEGGAGGGPVGAGEGGADDEIGEAVAVHIPGRGDRPPAVVERRLAIDLETIAAVEAGKLKRRAETRGLAENHIGGARVVAVRVGERGADDQIREALAVHVAGRSDRAAAGVALCLAVNLKAVGAVESR